MAEQKLKVYLETSFVSYLTGGETDNARLPPIRHILVGGGFKSARIAKSLRRLTRLLNP